MKKSVWVFLLVASLSLAGFASGSPEGVMSDFIRAGQEMDYQRMFTLLNPENEINRERAEEYGLYQEDAEPGQAQLEDFWREKSRKTIYQILSSTVEGDRAHVTVDLTYYDGAPLMEDVMGRVMEELLILAFAGMGGDSEMADEEAMEQIMHAALQEAVETIPETFVEETIQIELARVDDQWYIHELTEDVMNVFSCNVIKGVQTFEEEYQWEGSVEFEFEGTYELEGEVEGEQD
ncbi:MAG TPA: hypothetical protein DDW87_08595 [Firmicutes bacterium]|nr:hypothetical protein [Bacillota bacterium]